MTINANYLTDFLAGLLNTPSSTGVWKRRLWVE